MNINIVDGFADLTAVWESNKQIVKNPNKKNYAYIRQVISSNNYNYADANQLEFDSEEFLIDADFIQVGNGYHIKRQMKNSNKYQYQFEMYFIVTSKDNNVINIEEQESELRMVKNILKEEIKYG